MQKRLPSSNNPVLIRGASGLRGVNKLQRALANFRQLPLARVLSSTDENAQKVFSESQTFGREGMEMTSISSPQIGCRKAGGFTLPLVRIGIAIALGFAAVAGFAQTTTQYAINVTAPLGGVILPGSRINATTGQPVRYLWYGEAGATTG